MKHLCRTLLTIALIVASTAAAAAPPALVLCCGQENDLFRVLRDNGIAVRCVESPALAVEDAPSGGGVLILADDYPRSPVSISLGVFQKATEKKLRLYVEFPQSLPGREVGHPRAGANERAVVATDSPLPLGEGQGVRVSAFFGPDLPPLRILGINALWLTPVKAENSLLVAARVAGVDRAVYGLPDETWPLLFEHPRGNLLVATTALSHFVTARYAPADAWRGVWAGVLRWLVPGGSFPALKWTPTVRPSFGRDDALPDDTELQAVRRGLQWYERAQMVLSPSHLKDIELAVKSGRGLVAAPPPGSPPGDGSLGVLEAVMSSISADGSQMQGYWRRGDCQGESAMAMALGGKALGDKKYGEIADRVVNYWFFQSGVRDHEWADPNHGAYGLLPVGVGAVPTYGDDNARLMLGSMVVAGITGRERYDQPMMLCLLANFRTTSPLGFRDDCLHPKQLERYGWRHYFERADFVSYSPHMEAYLWACFLWAYQRTGYEPFLERTETALRMTMRQHTDGWRWTNGLAQERARMVLPLAWLVRVKDTAEHRRWLRTCVEGLLSLQQPCGAIREELGLPGKGMFAPPKVNRHYGTSEAPLIQENGDTISDLLYTTNFALLGLHEAAAATGDPLYRQAEDKLARFLCRIQIRSAAHPELDGGWFRGFDYRRWEYWASNSDPGWGAWCIETGWTQGWITGVLALRQTKESLWDYARRSGIAKDFDKLRRQMLPDISTAR